MLETAMDSFGLHRGCEAFKFENSPASNHVKTEAGTGLDFHEDLHRIGAKEGLKGRKLQKAMESYAWNITVLKGQADLLKHAKSEALDTLRQIHCAAQSCGLSKNGAASPQLPHHPHHQPQQVQIQQQPQAKPHPQPPPLHQSQTQPQSLITPQAYLHPLPQPHPQLPALPLVQTVTKPPAYPQPPPLLQPQFQSQSQQQRAAGPLEAIPEKKMVSDDPAGSC
ncbi:inactive phospholipase C-like protein 2 isoform X1 [Lates japonicus]|uniref:Inactive phospholipase C-like protein 2 isoform X1 n=1 Tax=Lates japonicus TaxID=270547 RepID=A0AAD3QZA5_LATJO|nr:inactive phospholipase C-like protein 2 isoform X1 [Lates japonicus]